MRTVILGARRRSEQEDEPLVNRVIDDLMDRYPQLKIVSGSCDRGVGKVVKTKCLPEEDGPRSKARFNFIEFHLRPYLVVPELTSAEFAEMFIARNAFLNEYGEEFHLFVDEDGPRGMMADLVNRIKQRKAPYVLYKPGDKDPKLPGR